MDVKVRLFDHPNDVASLPDYIYIYSTGESSYILPLFQIIGIYFQM